MSNDETCHQLHIEIPKEIYNELRTYLPERGLLTAVIKRFIVAYTKHLRTIAVNGGGPLKDATIEILDQDLGGFFTTKGGVIDGPEGVDRKAV